MEVPPVGLAFWRWGGGSLILLLFVQPQLRQDWPIILRHWKILIALSFLGVATFNTLVYTGLQFTTAINAFLIQSTMPVVIVILSYLFFRDRLTALQSFGVLLSLGGAAAIITQGELAKLMALSLNPGDLLIFIAVFCYAGYSAFLRQRPAMHPLSFLAITFILGTLMLLPFYIWENVAGRVMSLDTITLLSVAYVAVFPSILAYLFYNRGVELVGANRAGLFIHLMPAFGSLMAVGLLGEMFYWYHGLGILLILAGIWLANRKKQQTQASSSSDSSPRPERTKSTEPAA